MINVRAVILHDASKEKRERQLQAMLDKLSAGPSSVRALVRKFHRLPVNDARDLLDELVSRGRAIHLGGDRYEMACAALPHVSQGLTLEA